MSFADFLTRKTAHADGPEKVDESSDLARELGYRNDASQVDTSAFPKRAGADAGNQFCGSCQFFGGGASDEWGACVIFSAQLVNRNGWCNSWFERAG